MPVIEMKPHRMYVGRQGDTVTADNGDRTAGEWTWTFIGMCDVVPSGSANVVTLDDGTQTTYAYTVYLPAGTRALRYGERVRINIYGAWREFDVIGSHEYQLQTKVWI